MRRSGIILSFIVLAFAAGPTGPSLDTPPAEGSEVRLVRIDRVSAVLPTDWGVEPLADEGPRRGLRASSDLEAWTTGASRGLEAYWVDATGVGVPSDYYYLVASGPGATRMPHPRNCRTDDERVLLDARPRPQADVARSGSFVAISTGRCGGSADRTRWVSFVAAPGFGPVGEIGIRESGLYYGLAVVEDGADAAREAKRLLAEVRFDTTSVRRIIKAAGASL